MTYLPKLCTCLTKTVGHDVGVGGLRLGDIQAGAGREDSGHGSKKDVVGPQQPLLDLWPSSNDTQK